MIKAVLTVPGTQGMFDIFRVEQGRKGRSALVIQRKGKNIVFTVTAKDATAFRATVNTVTKLLGVQEKAEAIMHG